MKRTVAIIGATGSIGKQALDVIRSDKDNFEIVLATCNRDIKSLLNIAEEWNIRTIGLHSPLEETNKASDIKVLLGNREISSWIMDRTIDTLIFCPSGVNAFEVLRDSFKSFKRISIASKEIIVLSYISGLLENIKSKNLLMPIDSEHVAIHQLLNKINLSEIKKLIITASGGPIYSKAEIDEDLSWVTPEIALRHPTWRMGNKVTIDSATLFNKGIEIMEAKYLFGIPENKIEVLIHIESIIHALLELNDGFVLAEMAVPDMHLPIQYSLYYPEERKTLFNKCLDFINLGKLTFRNIDPKRIGSIRLAYEALRLGNIYPATYITADEVAVYEFLSGRLSFNNITNLVSETLEVVKPFDNINPFNIIELCNEIKSKSKEIMKRL